MSETNIVGSALKKSFFYGSGSIISKAIGFFMLPIYTRFLTPEDYGVASLLVFYISLIQLIFGAQLEQGINYFYHNEGKKLNTLWLNSVSMSAIGCLLPTIASWFFAKNISILLFNTDVYEKPLKLIIFAIALQILETYGMQYLRIIDRYKTYFFISQIKLFSQLTSNIYCIVVLDLGIIGVAIGTLTGSLVGSALASVLPCFNLKDTKISLSLLKSLTIYCYPLWLTSFIGLYTSSLPQFVIARLVSLSDLGLYNLANTLALLIGVLFWGPFFSYWQVERFKIQKKPNAKRQYQSFFKIAMLISSLITLGLSLLSKPVIFYMSDEAFHTAYKAVLPLALAVTFRYITWYLNFSFLITKKTHENLKNNIFNALITTFIISIGVDFSNFIGISWLLAISTVLTSFYCLVRSKKLYDMGINWQSFILLPASVSIIVIAINASAIDQLSLGKDYLVRIIICVFASVFVFSLLRHSYKGYKKHGEIK